MIVDEYTNHIHVSIDLDMLQIWKGEECRPVLLTIGGTSIALTTQELRDVVSCAAKVYREASETLDEMEVDEITGPDA